MLQTTDYFLNFDAKIFLNFGVETFKYLGYINNC